MCSPLCSARGEGGRYLCRPHPCLKEELSPPVLCVRQSLAAFSRFPTDRKAPIQVPSDRRAVCSFCLRAGEGFLPQSVRPSIRLAVCPTKKRAVSPPGPSGQRRERERLPRAAGHSRGRRGGVPCPSSLRLLLRSLSRRTGERKPPRVCRQSLVGGKEGFPVRAICTLSSGLCFGGQGRKPPRVCRQSLVGGGEALSEQSASPPPISVPNRQRRKETPAHTPPAARTGEGKGGSLSEQSAPSLPGPCPGGQRGGNCLAYAAPLVGGGEALFEQSAPPPPVSVPTDRGEKPPLPTRRRLLVRRREGGALFEQSAPSSDFPLPARRLSGAYPPSGGSRPWASETSAARSASR